MISTSRPQTTVILAMSADGKIAPIDRSPARFGSKNDKSHLEERLAEADAALFGAATLRAYGTTLPITSPHHLEARQKQGKPAQPTHIVCSHSGQLDPGYRFFQQPIPRWLLTSAEGAKQWGEQPGFDRILVATDPMDYWNWSIALQQLFDSGIEKLAVMGGGSLVAALLQADAIDELWLTVCPLLLGGKTAPTPVDGEGYLAELAPQLKLVELNQINDEIFLHYKVDRSLRAGLSGSP